MVELLPRVLQVLDPQALKTQTKANSDIDRIYLVSKVAKITGSLEAELWNTANKIPKPLS